MSVAQRLLLETLAGHFAVLESNCPRKAKTQAAKRAKRYVLAKLRHEAPSRLRLAA